MEENKKPHRGLLLLLCLAVISLLIFFGRWASQRRYAINEVLSRMEKMYDANVGLDDSEFSYSANGKVVNVTLWIRGSIGYTDFVDSAFLETSLPDVDWNYYCDLADELMARLETRFGLWWLESPDISLSLHIYVMGKDGLPISRTVAMYYDGTWKKYFENWQNSVSSEMQRSVLSLVYRRKEMFV